MFEGAAKNQRFLQAESHSDDTTNQIAGGLPIVMNRAAITAS